MTRIPSAPSDFNKSIFSQKSFSFTTRMQWRPSLPAEGHDRRTFSFREWCWWSWKSLRPDSSAGCTYCFLPIVRRRCERVTGRGSGLLAMCKVEEWAINTASDCITTSTSLKAVTSARYFLYWRYHKIASASPIPGAISTEPADFMNTRLDVVLIQKCLHDVGVGLAIFFPWRDCMLS